MHIVREIINTKEKRYILWKMQIIQKELGALY